MGLPTQEIGYGIGNDCLRCFGEGERFIGTTPAFITAMITGVKKVDTCPDYYPSPPNGTYLMAQAFGDACLWSVFDGVWDVWLDWRNHLTSHLFAMCGEGKPVGFSGSNPGICTRYFKSNAGLPACYYTEGMGILA